MPVSGFAGGECPRALGRVHYGMEGSERGSLVFRRSLFVVQNVQTGLILTGARALDPSRSRPCGQASARGSGPASDPMTSLGVNVRLGHDQMTNESAFGLSIRFADLTCAPCVLRIAMV